VKTKKSKYILKILIGMMVLLILLFVVLIPSSINKHKKGLDRYFLNLPSSIKVISKGGVESTTGSNLYFCFEISPENLEMLIKSNNYLESDGAFLKQNKFMFKDSNGKVKMIDGLKHEKSNAMDKGVEPHSLYIKDKSTYSNYSILFTNSQKTKVYFKHYRL